MSITKAALIEGIATDAGISKSEATKALESFQQQAMDSVKTEGRFSLSGFGAFKKRHKKASSGKVPGTTTGETWKKAAHNTVGFKPTEVFKDLLGKRK
jgi:DNA-binding protein HU-beta